MLRSMYSGISGIKNFQTKLDVIGNNIANVNTYGFKKGRVTFKDAMSQTVSGALGAQGNRGGVNPKQVGLGSAIATIDTIHTEASMQSTGRSLDLAINGDGYFVFKEGDQYFYSRAGNFYLDEYGTLVNADGYKVQAFDNDGNLSDVTVNVNAVMPYVETTDITIPGNLSQEAGVDFVYSQQFEVIDNEGNAHRMNIYFQHQGNGVWDVYFNNPEVVENPTPLMQLTFDNDGNIQKVAHRSVTVEDDTENNVKTITYGDFEELEKTDENVKMSIAQQIPVGDEFNFVSINFDFNSLKNNVGTNDAIIMPNGNTEGQLESFNISPTGDINGVYSNGLVATIGQLALAKFSNSSGLQSAGGNLFQATVNSGDANIDIAGQGRGSILTERLEMSNVDISEEFTEMIVAQRGFQANTRIITTSDEILQELVNLKR